MGHARVGTCFFLRHFLALWPRYYPPVESCLIFCTLFDLIRRTFILHVFAPARQEGRSEGVQRPHGVRRALARWRHRLRSTPMSSLWTSRSAPFEAFPPHNSVLRSPSRATLKPITPHHQAAEAEYFDHWQCRACPCSSNETTGVRAAEI